jgi:hypothetical protein
MANLNYQVFQYDGTVDKSPTEHPLIKFHKFNISGSANPQIAEKNLKQILDDHGHHDKDIILKIDIEDAEWSFFESLSEKEMLHFEQICVEFHNFLINEPGFIDRRIKVLEKINLTHQCVHFHANNYGRSCIISGFTLLPETFEITYLRRRHPVTRRQEYEFTECFKEFPIAGLDAPCCPDYPDIYIGRFNYDLNKGNAEIKKEHLIALFCEEIVKLHKSFRYEIKFLREETNHLYNEINSLHGEINSLHNEIAEKTSLGYFARKVKAFLGNRLLRLLR